MPQIGLGMSAAAFVTLALSIPLGRLSDRVGAKRLWMISAFIEALLYLAWPLASGFASFVLLLAVLASVETAGRSARNVYRIEVFPRDKRVGGDGLPAGGPQRRLHARCRYGGRGARHRDPGSHHRRTPHHRRHCW